MLEILKFIFQDFWHWLGFLMILVIVLAGLTDITRAIFGLFKGIVQKNIIKANKED